MEAYKLIDLTTFTGREGNVVYCAIVYFFGKGHNDLLKIVVDQNTYEELQNYLYQDVSNLISLSYNSFKKCYKPSISIK